MTRFFNNWGKLCVAATIMLIATFVFLTQNHSVEATHFQYGTYEWDTPQAQTTYFNLGITQGWRLRFWSNWNYNNSWLDRRPGVDTANVGRIKMHRLSGPTTAQATNTNDGSQNYLILTLTGAWADTTTSNDGYWYGTWSGQISNSVGPFRNMNVFRNLSDNYALWFDTCCRVATLMDGNQQDDNYITTWVIPNRRRYSLVTQGFPREYLFQGLQISDFYSLRSSNRENPSQTLSYSMSPTGTAIGGSALTVANPGLWGPSVTGSRLTLLNEKTLRWIPSIVVSDTRSGNYCRSSSCPYAISVTISDYLYPYVVGGQPNESAARSDWSTVKRIATQIDWMFIVIAQCTTKCPPTFGPREDLYYTIATVPNTVEFTITDNQTNNMVLQFTPTPPDLKFTQTSTVTSTTSMTITVKMVHDPDIDGAKSAMMCFTASNSLGLTAVGNYCPEFVLIRPNFMFVTGIIREFTESTDANRMDAATYPWPSGLKPSATITQSNRIPTIAPASGATMTKSAFDSWWSDNTSARLATANMVSYYNPTLDTSIDISGATAAELALYQAEPWMNPQRRVYSFRRPYWQPTSAQFYSYEVHTTFDLLPSQDNAEKALKFGVSGGELFVYINKMLVVTLSNANLSSPLPTQLIASPVTTTLTYAQIRDIIDPGFALESPPAPIPARNQGPETYDIDLFYTHRRNTAAGSTYTGFHLEFGSSSQCSAITVLRTQQWQHLVDASIIYDYTATGSLTGPKRSRWVMSNFFISNPQTALVNQAVQLLPTNFYGSAASIFYNNSILKVLNGFESTFSFKATANSPGFAFVIQSQSPSAKGSEGPGLGYAGITNAVAIEFDMITTDAVDGNYNFQHISVHRSTTANPRVSASETTDSWPLGSSPVGNLPNLPFTFNNGTQHDIKVELIPAQTAYWLYVYVNQNLKPLYTAQFPRAELDVIFKDGAYLGFTTSNYGSASQAGAVTITDFKMTVIPPMAARSGFAKNEPTVYTAVAGQTLTVKVQLRDACGSDLLVRGESHLFTAALIHRDSEKTATSNPDDAVDIPPISITDMDQGIYAISAPVTRSGDYQLYIYYREVGMTAGGQPLGNPALTYASSIYEGTTVPRYNKGDNEPFTPLKITPGVPDPNKSLYAYPGIIPAIDNTGSTSTTAGVTCVRMNKDLTNMNPTFFKVSNYATERTATTANQLLICVVRGFDSNTVAVITAAMTDAYTGKPSATNDYPASKAATFSAAWVYSTVASELRLAWSPVERVATTFTYEKTSIYVESWAPKRINAATVGRGMVLIRPETLSADPNTDGAFYLYSKDKYGNAVNNVNDVSFSFTPTLETIVPVAINDTPFTKLGFKAKSSGRFAFNAFFTDNPTQIGQSGTLVVDAGAAHHTTSLQSGVSTSGSVGSPMSFSISLRDLGNNLVTQQTSTRFDRVYIQWVNTETNVVASSLLFETGGSTYTTEPANHSTMFTGSQFENELYSIRYVPTFAGTFYVKIYINPTVGGSKYAPAFEMVDSKDKIVAIAAGPTHQKSTVTQLDANGAAVGAYTSYQAGQTYQFTVQTKDEYGNDRFVGYDGTKEIRLYLATSETADPITGTDFTTQVDSALSSNVGSNFLTGTYSGSGVYRFAVAFKKTTTAVWLSFHLVPNSAATKGTIVALVNTTGKTTANWSAAITAGELASTSIVGAWCPTALNTNLDTATPAPATGAYCTAQSLYRVNTPAYFAIQPLDRYSNQITPGTDTAAYTAVKALLAMQFENVSGAYDYISAFSIQWTSGNYYIGSFLPTRAGTYSMQAQLSSNSVTLAYQSTQNRNFGILPAATYLSTMPLEWPSALLVSESATLTFTDSDINVDPRMTTLTTNLASFLPETTFRITRVNTSGKCVVPSAGTCAVTSGGRPQYQCSFTPEGAGTSEYRLLAIGTVASGPGATKTCAAPTNDDCPTEPACFTSARLTVVTDGKTTAFIGGVARVNAQGADQDAVQIAHTATGTNMELHKAFTNAQGIRAGTSIALHIFQYVNNVGFSNNEVMAAMALRLVPQSGVSSKFKPTLLETTQTNVTLENCPASPAAGSVCAGRGGAAYFRVVLTENQVAADGENNNFEIWHVEKSTLGKIYSYKWRPTTFDPVRSALIGSGAREIEAGKTWDLEFIPVDIYGNTIFNTTDFTSWSSLTATLLSAGATPARLTVTPAIRTLLGGTTESVTVSFIQKTDLIANPSVKVTISGHWFTVMGIQAYYLAMRTTTTDPADWKTVSLQGNFQTVIVKAAPINLPNSIISLAPSADATLQLQSWTRSPPVAGEPFDLHILPKDIFGNPTVPQQTGGAVVSVKVVAGDRATTSITDINLRAPSNTWTWVQSAYSSSKNTIYTITGLTIAKTSRNGFKIAAQTPDGASTPQQTLYVRSKSLRQSPSADAVLVEYNAAATATLPVNAQNEYVTTIDTRFRFTVYLRDITPNPFVYTVGPTAANDNTQVSVTLTAQTAAGDANIKTIAATILQYSTTTSGVTYAVPGQFTVEANDLFFTGLYTLTVTVTDAAGTKPVLTSLFRVKAGIPYMDYTRFTLEPLQTRKQGTFKFQLYDRLQNLITDSLVPTKGPANGQAFYPITTPNKVYPSIHHGVVNCFDVHFTTANNLQYALQPVRPVAAPNYQIDTTFSAATSEYSVAITPAPSGTYSFNVTYMGASLTMPESWLSCNSVIPLGFVVATGPANAAKSYYTVKPINIYGQTLPWSSAGANVGSAGSRYQVDLSLLDADGNAASQSVQARLFYNPGDATSLNIDNDLYYESASNTNLLLNNENALTSQDLTADLGRGFWRFTFTPRIAKANYNFGVFIYEAGEGSAPAQWKRVTGIIPVSHENDVLVPTPSPALFTVIHGAPAFLVVDNLQGVVTKADETNPVQTGTPTVAGASTSFTVHATDAYGNPVTTTTSSTLEIIVRRDQTTFVSDPLVPITGLAWTIPSDSIKPNPAQPGLTSVSFIPPWEGQYSLSVRMVSTDGTTTFAAANAPASGQTIMVVHATCAGQHLAATGSINGLVKDKMCASTGVCVANFSECTAEGDKVTCPAGQTRTSDNGPCIPYSEVPATAGNTYVQCSDGTWVTSQSQCLPALSCPIGTSPCSADKTQCRSKESDCPAPAACPPGLIICPNQLTCAQNLYECPSLPQTVIDSCTTVLCPTGSCVSSSADCPTKPSCPMSMVYCLTDGSCQASATQCPQVPPAQILTPAICAVTSQILCPSGDKCATTIANCPSQMTCPVGQVLCALDNTCKATADKCLVPTTTDPTAPVPIMPDDTTAACSQTQFRCPSGECVQNLALCGSQTTCPSTTPVLCADKTCKSSLAVCTTPPTCPVNTVSCPSTGACVSGYEQCSTPLACPANKPVLCANSSCVATITDCEAPLSCPPMLPYTCPSSAVCRSALIDCPTLPNCPDTKPVVCDDGSCQIAQNMCLSATTPSTPVGGGTTANGCPTGLIRCNSGECSPNPLTCPTQVTCTPGQTRCGDGSCRVSCDAVQSNTCADRNLISCPQSAAGMACAKTLAECPQGFTCPLNKPVRCQDATCALSTTDCPTSQDVPPTERVPCPDGSWVTGTSSDCPTAVTCPPSAPIKCYDQTCQKTLDQCPVSTQCDLESTTPFRCPSGLCTATLWSCNSVDPTICAPSTPVKCPATTGGNVCVATLADCPIVGSGQDQSTTVIPDPVVTWTNPCPAGFTQCRDQSCAESPSSCPAFTCSVAFPHICPDGSCALNSSQCPSASGCPYNTPIKCSGVGNCVASLAQCSKPNCANGLVACADGSCATMSSECPAANGCRSTQTRCADGTCVDDAGVCTSQANSNYANSCPPGSPYKCPSGLCVAASYACPVMENQDPATACPSATPVRCADGICRASTQLCPIVKPCAPETQRCDDGFCRNIESNPNICPNTSNCPLGQIRCKQQDFPGVAILDGICAAPGQCLAVNGCQIENGAALQRCSTNGRCVRDLSICETNTRLTNGCLSSTPTKCWNGSCAASLAECPANNNCPAATPLRCPSGECVSTTVGCTTEQQQAACTKITCADGSCKDKASECITSFGCPITTPIRCADGQCKALPASSRPFLTNEQINTLTCPPVISCPSSNYFMCESGACVLSPQNCPSSTYNCDTSAPFRCLDNTCRPDSSKCGQIQNPEDPTQWFPSSTKPASCPSSLPVMCDNGACVSEIYNCDRNTNPETTTITGSPTSSQRDTTKAQVLCEDGSYRNNYAECRKFAQDVNADVAAANPALLCVDYCANGRCILEGQTVQAVCNVVPRCEVGQYRCFDGSCRDSCSDIPEPAQCAADETLNIDGVCRAKSNTLRYDGCYSLPHENYQCYNYECASAPEQCLAKETRKNDSHQLDILDHSEFTRIRRNGGAAASAISLEAIPNSIIAQFVHESISTENEVDDIEFFTALADTTTNPAGRSCQGSNCVSKSKAYSTSLMYSPLAAPQPFPIAPLATALTLQISSGLGADVSKDTNIYIQPVSESQYYNATNKLTYSRLGMYGDSDALTAAQTVLSPAFSCSVGDGLVEPFAVNIGVSSLIDRSMTPTPQPADVCLARLRRFPQFGYATWQCLFTDEQRKGGDLAYSVRQSASQPLRQAISTISQCYDDDLSTFGTADTTTGEMNVQQQDGNTDTTTTTTTTNKVPAVYAFINSPVAGDQVYLPAKDTFWRDNIIWLLFVIIGGICLVFFLAYAILRLSRYSKKTDNIKNEIANTEKEVEELENFGEKRRDIEVGYTANPLAVSLEQQKQLEETTNEEKIARKKQLLAAQQADSDERQEVIATLDQENEAALARLEYLRKNAKGGSAQ